MARVETLVETDDGRVVSVFAVHALGRTMIEVSDADQTLRAMVDPDRGICVQSGYFHPLLVVALGRILKDGPVADLIERGQAPALSVLDGGAA